MRYPVYIFRLINRERRRTMDIEYYMEQYGDYLYRIAYIYTKDRQAALVQVCCYMCCGTSSVHIVRTVIRYLHANRFSEKHICRFAKNVIHATA